MSRPAATLVALATYNERENLPRLVDEILHILPDADLLVVDDNSPDGTGAWCQERAEREPRLTCVGRAGKLGLGSATLLALQHAVDGPYAEVITMDADGSHPPRSLPALLEGAVEADVVIGSRYCDGGRIEGWSWHRRRMSQLLNLAARVLLGLPVRDCSGAFRCYRTEILRKIDRSSIRASGFAYLEEILFLLNRERARFREVPIVFVDRQCGASKLNWGEARAAMAVLMRLFGRRLLGR